MKERRPTNGWLKKMSWKCLSKNTKGIHSKEPPYAERHVRWCERSENESRKKTTSFSSYSIVDGCIDSVKVKDLLK